MARNKNRSVEVKAEKPEENTNPEENKAVTQTAVNNQDDGKEPAADTQDDIQPEQKPKAPEDPKADDKPKKDPEEKAAEMVAKAKQEEENKAVAKAKAEKDARDQAAKEKAVQEGKTPKNLIVCSPVKEDGKLLEIGEKYTGKNGAALFKLGVLQEDK